MEGQPPAKMRLWDPQKADYWAAVANHLGVKSKPLHINTACKDILKCTGEKAREFANISGAHFDSVI